MLRLTIEMWEEIRISKNYLIKDSLSSTLLHEKKIQDHILTAKTQTFCTEPDCSADGKSCTSQSTVKIQKLGTVWFQNAAMHPNNADRMVNSVDPNQTAPFGAV